MPDGMAIWRGMRDDHLTPPAKTFRRYVRNAVPLWPSVCDVQRSGRLFEIFIRLGKSGGCAAAVNEGAARLASNALRSGTDPETIFKSLQGISCHQAGPSMPSCLASVAEAIKLHIGDER